MARRLAAARRRNVLANQHGAVLTLTGKSVGAIVSADLNGLAVTVK